MIPARCWFSPSCLARAGVVIGILLAASSVRAEQVHDEEDDSSVWSLFFHNDEDAVTEAQAQTKAGAKAEAEEEEDQGSRWSFLSWGSDDDEEGDKGESPERSFFYKEAVVSGFYSPKGAVVSPRGMSKYHFELNPRPPGNYVGFDYVQTFNSDAYINDVVLPDWLPLTAMDLHPRLVYDRMENGNGLEPVKFAPQDFWFRFNPRGMDRFTLRVGEFVLPYGMNPIMAPRQRFLLPLEATDLGLKWDWGIDLKGPIDEYEWEAAATIGSGEGVHSPDWFGKAENRTYLFTGRVGTPTYWDLQYGLSCLYGDLPMVRAVTVLDDHSVSRWRIGGDGLYKYGTYLMTGAQVTFGQDGFAGDGRFVPITMGKSADVFGGMVWADWVVPTVQDLRFGVQFESLIRDLGTANSDDTAGIVEVGYSLLTSVTAVLDYRGDLNRSMGENDNALFLTLIYYGQ